MAELGSGRFAGREEVPVVGEASPPALCVLDDRRPGQRALVTGASSGIGRSFAEHLAAAGWNLTLVARDLARLDALRDRLTAAHGVDIRVLRADLAAAAGIEQVAAEIEADDSLDLVINNAGVAMVSPLVDSDPAALVAMMQLHGTAVVLLTRAALVGMTARRRGAVINVSSAGAFVSAPVSATYCASKTFVNSFTEAVHGEMAGSNVQVQALCPGMTMTEMHVRGGFDVSWVPSWMSADDVVECSLAGLRMGEVTCVPGLRDPGIVGEMRAAGARVVEQTIESVVADRYRTTAAVR
jgi:hypothetical protein